MIRKPWLSVGVWALIVLLALPGARKAPTLLFAGSGDISGSASLRADSLLRADFPNPYSQLLVLTLRSDRIPEWDTSSLIRDLEVTLRSLPEVVAVTASPDFLDKRMWPKPGTGAVLMIGMKAATVRDAEQAIPAVRQAAGRILVPAREADPGLQWAVTGRSALTYDLNLFSSTDTSEAEMRVFPLTLIILLVAFGSLVAAGVPLLMGILSTTLSLAVAGLLARHWALSNLVQNVSSMIGLAVGIDYSLLIIHRYRETLADIAKAGGHARVTRSQRSEALILAMGSAGKAVFYSGLTVLIGLGGLLFTPLMETRSIGWGGCVVVLVSVAGALTFLPALLLLIGPALDWPRALSSRFGGARPSPYWERWSHWVMARAPLCAILGLAVIAVLSWPGRFTRFGFPEGPFIPKELEFTRGFEMLREMELGGMIRPVDIILTASEPVLTPDRIPGLLAFSARIRTDSAVARIFGPVDLADDWPLEKTLLFYGDVDGALEQVPSIRDFFLSRDGNSLQMQVMLKPGVQLEEAKRLAREIPAWMQMPDLDIAVGGQAVFYNDFDGAVIGSYGPSVAFVLSVTFVALLILFRSPLMALKALVMNGASVLAGYGAVVYVFQLGNGHALFGSPGPSHVVPLTIPLMLFCILFGLSMDYEVFLLSRIREGYLKSRDNTRAVAEGLSVTGPVITSAALIMVAVFGAFAFARVVVVQMLGLGLAVSVLVDAVVIRVLLVPAFMKMAGRWNWWPGLK